MLLAKALSILFMLVGLAVAVSSLADSIEFGQATVIDGDTIEINGERIRLFGVDAPESSQLCQSATGKWMCGKRSAMELADYLGKAHVSCRPRGTSYNRIVAACFKGLDDVARHQARAGWVVAADKYSLDYVPDEAMARNANRGIWTSRFELPWFYRAKQKKAKGVSADEN